MLKNTALQQLIAQKILVKPSPFMDAKVVAALAAAGWHRTANAVATVIGDKGIHALYARSLQLTSNAHTCLAAVDTAADEAPFTKLELQLAACDASQAIAASNSLFVNFIELLSTLIGESLTEQLVQKAWRDAPSTEQASQHQTDHHQQ